MSKNFDSVEASHPVRTRLQIFNLTHLFLRDRIGLLRLAGEVVGDERRLVAALIFLAGAVADPLVV